MAERRFPPPWSIEDIGEAFVVRDYYGQRIAYIYYEDAPSRHASTDLLTRVEARRIAGSIANLPELLRNKQGGGNQIIEWLRQQPD